MCALSVSHQKHFISESGTLCLFLKFIHNAESVTHLQCFTYFSEEQCNQQSVGETGVRDADQMYSREQAGPRERGVEDLPLPLQHHTDAARGGEWML